MKRVVVAAGVAALVTMAGAAAAVKPKPASISLPVPRAGDVNLAYSVVKAKAGGPVEQPKLKVTNVRSLGATVRVVAYLRALKNAYALTVLTINGSLARTDRAARSGAAGVQIQLTGSAPLALSKPLVLQSLLFPGVQQTRDIATKTHCRSNPKQMGLALHDYAGAGTKLPPLATLYRSACLWAFDESVDLQVADELQLPYCQVTGVHGQSGSEYNLSSVCNVPYQTVRVIAPDNLPAMSSTQGSTPATCAPVGGDNWNSPKRTAEWACNPPQQAHQSFSTRVVFENPLPAGRNSFFVQLLPFANGPGYVFPGLLGGE